jgi:hypothetical protein
MIISISIHLAVLLVVYFLTRGSKLEDPNYIYFNSYTLQLTNKFSNDTTFGSGGSFGNAANDIGEGLSAPKTLAGIPVPSAEESNIDFSLVTNFEEPKDSLMGGESGIGTGQGTGIGSGKGKGIGDGSDWGVGSRSLPFVPRQILEVLPQNIEREKGEILILLKIGKDGYVKEHKVIINTIDDPIGLRNVLEAAYKSRWEKIKIEGSQIEYWVEKKYRFN